MARVRLVTSHFGGREEGGGRRKQGRGGGEEGEKGGGVRILVQRARAFTGKFWHNNKPLGNSIFVSSLQYSGLS